MDKTPTIHIEVAGKDGCGNCDRALKFVSDWSEINELVDSVVVHYHKAPTEASSYRAFVDSLKARVWEMNPGETWETFPFIWINGHFVGGYVQLQRALMKMHKDGR